MWCGLYALAFPLAVEESVISDALELAAILPTLRASSSEKDFYTVHRDVRSFILERRKSSRDSCGFFV